MFQQITQSIKSLYIGVRSLIARIKLMLVGGSDPIEHKIDQTPEPAISTFILPNGTTIVVHGAVGILRLLEDNSTSGYVTLIDENNNVFKVVVHKPIINNFD